MSNITGIIIRPSFTSFAQCIFIIVFSVFPFALVYTPGGQPGWLSILVLCIPSGIIVYYGIEKLFVKRIQIVNDKIFFWNGPFKYQLDRQKMTVYYEKVSVWGGNYKDYFGLVLYRDINKIIGFSMNNKFVLAYEIDEVKFEYYQQQFSDKFDIDIKVIKPFF